VKPSQATNDQSYVSIGTQPTEFKRNDHRTKQQLEQSVADSPQVSTGSTVLVPSDRGGPGQNMRNHSMHSQKVSGGRKRRKNFFGRVVGVTTQHITPNPEIPCTPGWCLVYVRETFGIGPKYPTATAGWNASTYKHTDQNFPNNTWVPVWFSLSDNPDGHVVLRQPDGSIWSASSPTATTPVHHASLTELERYYGNRLNYLGWTEDLEDTLIMNG
jgi:hypothetical protein